VIQNAADLPVGQAAVQLCKMLKIRTINLVPDDPGFERSKELLMQVRKIRDRYRYKTDIEAGA